MFSMILHLPPESAVGRILATEAHDARVALAAALRAAPQHEPAQPTRRAATTAELIAYITR